MPKKEKVYWFENGQIGKTYGTSTFYRCHKIEEFVKLVEKEHDIVGITFEDNLIGFILDGKR